MKNLKKILLTTCSLVLTPMFLSNAKGDDYQTLKSGRYGINTQKDIILFSIGTEGDIIPVDSIKSVDTLKNGQPTTFCTLQ